jgi:hypothetical protein
MAFSLDSVEVSQSLWGFFHGAWIEGLIVAVALHIYLFHYSWLQTSKSKRGADRNCSTCSSSLDGRGNKVATTNRQNKGTTSLTSSRSNG